MLSFILAIALTVTMMPWLGGTGSMVYAETATAPGGTIASNSETDATEVFGSGNVTVSKGTGSNSNVMTITLNSDITLDAAVKLTMGAAGDKVVLNLNNHTIKGAAGIDSSDKAEAKGKNAIEISPAAYDVVIQGPGTIIGGDGAVYEADTKFKSGQDGGAAVCFLHSTWSPNGGKLEHGLTVTGGANLKGGNGADVTSEEWLYNIGEYTGGRSRSDKKPFEAGCGGAGISQEKSAVLFGSSSLAFARIVVENGTVTGGKGGSIDLSEFTPTYYALMNTSAAAAAMSGATNYYCADNILSMAQLNVGPGGDGIKTGNGRKYVRIDANGAVKGNSCGSIDFGSGKYMNQFTKGVSYGEVLMAERAGDAGDGIAVWVGAVELKRIEAGYSGNGWQDKSMDSDDMGIYIAGNVSGGDAPDVNGFDEDACDGGAGIGLYGDNDRFGYAGTDPYPSGEGQVQWGIVCVDEGGTVTGGNGGSSVSGSGGAGGVGIYEVYDKGSNDYGTDYYIINGRVNGGNGGNSLSRNRSFGNGGNGVDIKDHYRENAHFAGSGKITAGNSGVSADPNDDVSGSSADAIYCYSSRENYFTVTEQDGNPGSIAAKDEIAVSASMSSFSGYPTTSTEISCSWKPQGYTGGAYIKWFASLHIPSNTEDIYEIEPTGTNNAAFNLADNDSYQYLDYEGTPYTHYHLDIATVERMIEEALQNNGATATIYCNVLLDDGRWGKSNELVITKDGYTPQGPDPDDPQDADQQAADAVIAMIEDLPGLGSITLEHADAVAAARAAYEALTPAQKELLAQYTYLLDFLADAESRIAELQGISDQEEADRIAEIIDNLPTADNVTLEDEEAVIAAREAYDNLTDAQKAKVSQDALDKLEAAEAVIGQLNQEAADVVISKINQIVDLSTLNPEDTDYATKLEAAKTAIEQASQAYGELSPTQKELIDAADKEKLRGAVEQYNEMFPDNPIDDPTVTEITADMITVADETYTGKALTPKVTVKDGNRILTEGDDYEKRYSNNTNAGKGKVTVTGKGDYTGEASKEFTINPKKITPAVSLSAAKYTWNGKVIKPAVTVKNGNAKLAASQYTVTYAAGGKNVGTHNVTVKLKGNYSGTRTASFTIVPKGATIVKPKPAKKALTAKWKKQSAKMSKSRITGYQIQCSTSKSFKSGVKTKKVKGFKKTSVKVSKLKGKKKYYVRVRTYMKTGGKTYYSGWSGVKTVKTK